MRLIVLSVVIIVIDQLSKLFVKGFAIPFLDLNFSGMFYGERIPLIGNIFSITFVENPGIAFGIDFGEEFKLFISLFTLAASIGLIVYFYIIKNKDFILRFSIALILGGAVGNLIDRMFYGIFYGYAPLFYGKVVDFLDFRLLNLHIFNRTLGSYILNFADIAVTVGVIILFYALNRQKKKGLEKEQNEIQPVIENYLADNKD